MTSSDNEDDNGYFKGNISLHVVAVSTIPPLKQAIGRLDALDPAFDPLSLLATIDPLFCEQLQEFIMDTIKFNAPTLSRQWSNTNIPARKERNPRRSRNKQVSFCCSPARRSCTPPSLPTSRWFPHRLPES
ncbi:UNVERIFIED_CONTAM: hypothetical protein Sangu_2517700 [Sesamum angustifolium]|uniref:Uncharacterized protein n=1 Tax=Sesamum angustifolium TaxID=2727405 RepID=A0AAW2JL08_9LAMI